jgi:hypothetical protein
MAQISDRRRKKLEIAKNDLEREAEITVRKPDGVMLVTLVAQGIPATKSLLPFTVHSPFDIDLRFPVKSFANGTAHGLHK